MPEVVLILIRSLLAFFTLLILARMMGKQQLSQLSFFDYIVGITIGSIAAEMSVDQNTKILNGFVGLLVWGGLPILLGMITLKSYRMRLLIDGRPSILIKDGQILEKNLQKNKMNAEQLMLLLRQKNVFKLSDVEFAIMETDGGLSVLKKTDQQPITPKNLGLQVEQENEPRIVIIDGNLMERTLHTLNFTKEWLLGEIQKQGASDFQDVFLAQIDTKGNVYVDLYKDDHKRPQVQQKLLTAATLKKVQADLETFARETENEQAKQDYQRDAQILEGIIDELAPYLK